MSKVEHEVWGLTYERYAMGRLIPKLVRKLDIKTVLEIPGAGVKAMPSIYSIPFALSGCEVTIVNGIESYRKEWARLGIGDKVRFVKCEDLSMTGLPADSCDFVWNFAVFGKGENYKAELEEMIRLSRRYLGIFQVNRMNLGTFSHKFAHRWTKIPWSHGDSRLRKMNNVKTVLKDSGLVIRKTGWVDTPPWPDSPGFRDIRLHRKMMETKQELTEFDWHSEYVDYLETGEFPNWMKWVYAFESIPMHSILKQLYAHLFYIIAAKAGPVS